MRRGTVLLALVLILLGTYALLPELGLTVPSIDRLWPVLPFGGGIALLWNYLRKGRRDHGDVFWGTGLTLMGLFLFLVTLGEQDYSVLHIWWPVFVAIAGISFLALWLADGAKDRGVLFLAIVGLAFGGTALAINLQLLGPNTAHELSHLWPALLILAGLILLLRGLLGGKKAK